MDGKLNPRDAGLTLIELMVVIAILSVLAVGVSVTAMRGTAAADASDMAWFRTQFDHHQRLAVTSATSFGLYVSPKELRVARMRADGWDPQGSARAWRGRVAHRTLNATPEFDAPDIILRASGQSSAFNITFGAGTTCTSDGWNGLVCDNN